MMATGIVRRVDDLGRVVIPKEIRRRFGIREGEPLEIYTTEDGIVFRKYNRSFIEEIDAIEVALKEHYDYGYLHHDERLKITELFNEVKAIIEKAKID